MTDENSLRPFPRTEKAMEEAESLLERETEEMTPAEAEETLRRLEELYGIIADREVEDEDSDETLEWEALLEEMDDMMDELRDALEDD